MDNTVLEKFHQGRQSLGTFSAIGSPLAVESLRYTGLDNVIVENTPYTPITEVRITRQDTGSKTVRKSMMIMDSFGLSMAVKKALVTMLNHVNK